MVIPGFFGLTIIKCEGDKLKKRLLNIKESGLSGFEKPHLLQIANYLKLRTVPR